MAHRRLDPVAFVWPRFIPPLFSTRPHWPTPAIFLSSYRCFLHRHPSKGIAPPKDVRTLSWDPSIICGTLEHVKVTKENDLCECCLLAWVRFFFSVRNESWRARLWACCAKDSVGRPHCTISVTLSLSFSRWPCTLFWWDENDATPYYTHTVNLSSSFFQFACLCCNLCVICVLSKRTGIRNIKVLCVLVTKI